MLTQKYVNQSIEDSKQDVIDNPAIARLGAAEVTLTFSDSEGFVVRRGVTGEVLAYKHPSNCDESEWEGLWEFFTETLKLERVR